MTDPNHTPDPQDARFGEVVDGLLGEGPAAGASELSRSLEGLLASERSRFAEEEALAAADGPRLARFLVARAREDEAAHRAAQRARMRRSRWGRILAISVGVHALLLGFVVWNLGRDAPAQAPRSVLLGKLDNFRSPTDRSLSDDVANALDEYEVQQLDKLPDSVFAFDDVGGEDQQVPDEIMAIAEQGAAKTAIYEWPRGMALSLARRRSEVLKKSRLRALGYDSGPTLDAVRRGLRYLASTQGKNGSFPSSGDTDPRVSTALALLPFLGDGHFSLASQEAPGVEARETAVVRRGLAYLRGSVFEGETLREGLDRRILHPVLIALSEDYMLGYGRLLIKDAQDRSREIRTLVAHLRADESLLGAEDALWSHWALDAAARTGVVESLPMEQRGYAAWRTAVANGPSWSQSIDADALARGTALIGLERGAKKARFREWQPATTEALLRQLQPNGKAKGRIPGDRVERTARIVLALQLGYRSY